MAENKNRYITVAYKLYSDNEKGIHEIFEEAPEEHPFQFITGLSAALPAFEAQVAELNAGDSFDFTPIPAPSCPWSTKRACALRAWCST